MLCADQLPDEDVEFVEAAGWVGQTGGGGRKLLHGHSPGRRGRGRRGHGADGHGTKRRLLLTPEV